MLVNEFEYLQELGAVEQGVPSFLMFCIMAPHLNYLRKKLHKFVLPRNTVKYKFNNKH